MTHRDLPLGSDVKWHPSLLSDALCCSQLVQMGLEKDRETEGLSPSKIRFLVLFLKGSPLFNCFLWAHEHVKYTQQICQTFHLACRVKKPSKVKLIIDTRCSQSTRAQAVTFTPLDVTLSDWSRRSWQKVWGVREERVRKETSLWGEDEVAGHRLECCIPVIFQVCRLTNVVNDLSLLHAGGRWDVSKRRHKITRRTFYSCWQ